MFGIIAEINIYVGELNKGETIWTQWCQQSTLVLQKTSSEMVEKPSKRLWSHTDDGRNGKTRQSSNQVVIAEREDDCVLAYLQYFI